MTTRIGQNFSEASIEGGKKFHTIGSRCSINLKCSNWLSSFEQSSSKHRDDQEEDEAMPDMELNPFAVSDASSNEKLYSADPKKFLKEW